MSGTAAENQNAPIGAFAHLQLRIYLLKNTSGDNNSLYF
jgi:hypothetical protein